MESITSEFLQGARLARLLALREIQAEMERLEISENNLARTLMSAAPKVACKFLVKEKVIDNLLKIGQFSRRINLSQNDYGFKTARKVREIFGRLKKAWNGAVEIIFIEEAGGIEVIIKVP